MALENTSKQFHNVKRTSWSDAAVRLDLMAKVYGIEEAERFFSDILKQRRYFKVQHALLNCYAREKLLSKAEALMEKLKSLRFYQNDHCFNILLNLYYWRGDYKKVDDLVNEMEQSEMRFEKYIYGIWLSTSAAASDVEKFEKILSRMQLDSNFKFDWATYSMVASGYCKLGQLDKAHELLKKYEEALTPQTSNMAYNFLLTHYAAVGKKDEVLRLWKTYKRKREVYNKGYSCIISSLLKFDDIENAEMIFEEWMSSGLSFDIRIPNILISGYARTGLLEKAGAVVDGIVQKGGSRDENTWCHLATAYLRNNQTPEAFEVMKKAILVCPSGWTPTEDSLTACLGFIIGKGSADEANEFMESLRTKGIVSVDVQDSLVNCVPEGHTSSEVLAEIVGNSFATTAESSGQEGTDQGSRCD